MGMVRSVSEHLPIPILVAVLVAWPQLLHNAYLNSIMVFIGLYGITAIGLCLLMGYAGQISLGQAAFFAMGAYVSGILTATYKQSPWLAMVVAMIVVMVVSAFVGVAILRFSGHVLAVVTLSLNIIVYVILVEFDSVTGGLSPGLGGIPRLSIGSFKLTQDIHYYYLIWAVLGVIFILSWNLVHSRVGRALRSMHSFYGGSEEAAESLGVDTKLLKVQIFVLSAVFASVAGTIYAHYVTYINPAPFDILLSLELVVMVVLGGLRNLWGAVAGSALVVALGEILREFVPKLIPGALGEYQIIAHGLVLILVLILLPEGIVSAPAALLELWRKLPVARAGVRGTPTLKADG